MANRYWILGTGTWDNASTAHWSASSGGIAGASTPTSADNVIIDSNSGFLLGGTITVDDDVEMNNLTCTSGHTYTLTCSGIPGDFQPAIYGSATFESGLTTGTSISFSSSSSGNTITRNGSTIYGLYTNGTGEWTLQDDLIVTNNFSVTGGTFNANNKNITAPFFQAYNDAGDTVLNMGSGTWTITGIGGGYLWYAERYGVSSFAINSDTSTIKFTDSSNTAGEFYNNPGFTYNNVWFSRGASTGSITIVGSNTFNDFKDEGSVAHSLLLTTGTTQTVTTFTVSGTAGQLKTINSTTTGTHALVKSGGGTISCDYLNIQHSVATPGTTWYAGTNSTNNQAVVTAGSGWTFTAPPAPGGSTRKTLGLLGVG